MTNIMAEAVEAIEKKLDGSVFDGSAKFAIEDEGSIIIDSSGVFDRKADVKEKQRNCTRQRPTRSK